MHWCSDSVLCGSRHRTVQCPARKRARAIFRNCDQHQRRDLGQKRRRRYYINSYTTDEEVKNYLDILKTQGQDGLEKAFDKTKERGRLAMTGTTGNDISFIRSRNAETKRIIRMASNRMMSFAELYNSPRSRDYKFTIIELRLDADGNGEGNIFYATKLKFNKQGQLEIEHYGQTPIRLANVRKQK